MHDCRFSLKGAAWLKRKSETSEHLFGRISLGHDHECVLCFNADRLKLRVNHLDEGNGLGERNGP